MPVSISFVIPCYKSSSMIEGVIRRLQNTVERRFKPEEYEIVLVDDYSPDNTFAVLKDIAMHFSNVKVVGFSKNFGQQAALMAGFSMSTGKVVVCLDDDGQTPPEEVFSLVDKLDEGFDIVYASYENKHHSWFRNFGSWINEKMAESLIGKPKNITLSSFYAVRRFLVEDALRYTSPFPYIAGQLLRSTSNIANIPIEHQERLDGKSGYTLKKLLSLWLNGFTAFSIKPLRIASLMGIALSVCGLVFAIFVIIRRLIEPTIAVGWTSTFSLILIIGGLILFVLGLIGEYVGRVYISINNAPQYVIKRTVNCRIEDENEFH